MPYPNKCKYYAPCLAAAGGRGAASREHERSRSMSISLTLGTLLSPATNQQHQRFPQPVVHSAPTAPAEWQDEPVYA